MVSEKFKNVLSILARCIENGKEVIKLCDDTPEALKANPLVKQLIEKIKCETNSIAKFKKELDSHNESHDYLKWKSFLQEMINSTQSMSDENVNQINQALVRSKISKAKKNCVQHNEMMSNFEGDDATKEFVKTLNDRNLKILNCLTHVHSIFSSNGLAKKKLFIFGEDLQRSMRQRQENKNRLGTVTIQGGGAASTSASTFTNVSSANPQQILFGFLKDENGNSTEVVLELRSTEGNITNLSSTQKLSATLAIDGEAEFELEVFEVNADDVPHEGFAATGTAAIAVVHNESTGIVEEVPIQMIPQREIHGQILQLQAPNEEQLAEINARTPYNLTPPKTPRAPLRQRQTTRRNFQPRNLNFGEEQLDDIMMDLVDNSMHEAVAARELTQEQISQITMDLFSDLSDAHGSVEQRTPTIPREDGMNLAIDSIAEAITNEIVEQEQLEDVQLDLIDSIEADESMPMERVQTPRFLTPPKTPKAPKRSIQRRTQNLQARELDFGEERIEDMDITLIDNSANESIRHRLPNLTNENLEDMDITFAPDITNASNRQISFKNFPSGGSSKFGTPKRVASRIKDRSLHYGTPSRFPRKAQLPKIVIQPSREPIFDEEEEHISQVEMDLIEDSLNSTGRIFRGEIRTPYQLTPPKTPAAPGRLRQMSNRQLLGRNLDFGEEQLDNIEIDLVENSMDNSRFPDVSTEEQLSQVEISFAPELNESEKRVLPPTSRNARSIYGTPRRSPVSYKARSPHYGTPSRLTRKAHLPKRPKISAMAIPESDEHISQIDMDLIEDSLLSPRLMRTPLQLTPPHTPSAPQRQLHRTLASRIPTRVLNFTEEQLDDIDLDLVENSMDAPNSPEHLSRIQISLASDLEDSQNDEAILGSFRNKQSPARQRFDNSNLMQFHQSGLLTPRIGGASPADRSLSRIPVSNKSRIRHSLPSRLTPNNLTNFDRSLNIGWHSTLSPLSRSMLNQNLQTTENLPFVPSSEFAPQYISDADELIDDIEPMEFADEI